MDDLQSIQNETRIESLALKLEINKLDLWPKWSSSDLDSFVNLFTNAQELKIVLDILGTSNDLNEADNTLIKFEKLLKLKEFNLSVLKPHSIFSCFSHNCLKSLVAESNSVEIWKKFAQNNPNIVDLKIKSNPFNEIVPMLTEELKLLKRIELHPEFYDEGNALSTQVFDAILKNCQNLEYLQLNNLTSNNPLDMKTFEKSLKEKSVEVRICRMIISRSSKSGLRCIALLNI